MIVALPSSRTSNMGSRHQSRAICTYRLEGMPTLCALQATIQRRGIKWSERPYHAILPARMYVHWRGGGRLNMAQNYQGYIFSISDSTSAVDALETTVEHLEAVAAGNIVKWKWAIIALHHAVQSFMVLALKSTWRDARVTHRDYRDAMVRAEQDYRIAIQAGDDIKAQAILETLTLSSGSLASFNQLYARIKDPDGAMRQFMHSRNFEPRAATAGSFDDDGNMIRLNEVRGELMHPSTDALVLRTIEFERFADTGLHIIEFLLSESNNLVWHPTVDAGLEERAGTALARASQLLQDLSANRLD